MTALVGQSPLSTSSSCRAFQPAELPQLPCGVSVPSGTSDGTVRPPRVLNWARFPNVLGKAPRRPRDGRGARTAFWASRSPARVRRLLALFGAAVRLGEPPGRARLQTRSRPTFSRGNGIGRAFRGHSRAFDAAACWPQLFFEVFRVARWKGILERHVAFIVGALLSSASSTRMNGATAKPAMKSSAATVASRARTVATPTAPAVSPPVTSATTTTAHRA